MDTPQPVDLSKLKGILGNAKKLIQVTENKFPSSKKSVSRNSNYNSNYNDDLPYYDEKDERDPYYVEPIEMNESNAHLINQNQHKPQPNTYRDYTAEDIQNSKLPSVVKEAMLRKPIPRPSISSMSFSLDGLEDLVEKPVNQRTNNQITERKVTNHSNDTITISKAELTEFIDNRINAAITNILVKTISEQSIKKTISTLINEGKLTTKKKI